MPRAYWILVTEDKCTTWEYPVLYFPVYGGFGIIWKMIYQPFPKRRLTMFKKVSEIDRLWENTQSSTLEKEIVKFNSASLLCLFG